LHFVRIELRLISSIPLKVEINLRSAQHHPEVLRISDSIEFIDENGGGPGVRLKKRLQKKKT
jgi:hypothetical protein